MFFFKKLCLFLSVNQIIFVTCQLDSDLSSQITQEKELSNTFILPENAYRYQATNKVIADFGSYDFIIVGAGAAGAALASRLSEQFSWKILLLEAGPNYEPINDVPALGKTFLKSRFNWGYQSVPQDSCCVLMKEHRCDLPRGLGIGGTTLINNLIYLRGSPTDWDRWGREFSGWTYHEVLPFFKKSEHFFGTTLSHGTFGPMQVEFYKTRSKLLDSFLEANQLLGVESQDLNGPHPVGSSLSPYNTKYGKRLHSGSAFLTQAKFRANLKIVFEALVVKVLLTKSLEAHQVEFLFKGQTYRATAFKEIILSAGSINTPQLLMLSGIGPKDHLESLGISVVNDLKVGRYLDHAVFTLNFNSNFVVEKKSERDVLTEFRLGKGLLTVNEGPSVIGVYQTERSEHLAPDLELILTEGPKGSFSVQVVCLHCKSEGSVRLRSKNPLDYPIIDPRLLSDSKDSEKILDGIELALKLLETFSFKEFNISLLNPNLESCLNHEFKSRDYFRCALRYQTQSLGDSVGTCPMGQVVDHNLQVLGLKKLRIADSSIFPFTLSGHPSAACTMIAEKLADQLRKPKLRVGN